MPRGFPVQRLIRFMMLAPGHFHAALVHKQPVLGVHPRVYVYGPLDDDTFQQLEWIRQFNSRPIDPTKWEVQFIGGPGYLERFQQQTPGNTVLLAGRNSQKIDLMKVAIEQNVDLLVDKPWIVHASDFTKLLDLYSGMDLRDVIAWDMMTERFDPLTQIQRELMRDPDIFGSALIGTPDHPTLTLESVHCMSKIVAGKPMRRPVWWFNPAIAGTALTDVGTHLADLAMWLLFPDMPIDYRRDIQIGNATAWPTMLEESQFEDLAGVPAFPTELKPYLQGRTLHYPGNGSVDYTLRGAHVRLTVIWEYEETEDSGELHEASALGNKSRITVRNTRKQQQLTIKPSKPKHRQVLYSALSRRCQNWQGQYPGLSVHDLGEVFELRLPSQLRGNHEAHFLSVVREFMTYFNNTRRVPSWERSNLLAKYWLTTQADLISQAGK